MTTTPRGPRTCDPDRLWAVAVGVLPADEAGAHQQHLTDCGECRQRLEIRADVDALGCHAGPGASPDALAARVLERARAAQARARLLRWLALGAVLIAATAAGLAIAHRLTVKAMVRRDLWRVNNAIQRVQNAEGRYPADEQELVRALGRLADPEVRVDDQGRPVDAWGRPLRYRFPGVHAPGLFDLWSLGADGRDDDGAPDDQPNWPR